MRMLDRYIVIGLVVFSTFVSTVFADDFSISLALRGNYNHLKIRISNELVNFGDDAEDSTLLLGPSLKLAYKKIFGGINWMSTIDRYSIHFYSVTQNATGNVDISVRDLDLLIGYMIIPRIGVFAGYKSISSNMTDLLGHSFDFKVKGGAFGATANLPLGSSPFLFSVNGSYMPWLKYTFLEEAEYARQDMRGFTVEIWFTYAGMEHFAFSIGGKAQTFESELKDEFRSSGITFSLDYRF